MGKKNDEERARLIQGPIKDRSCTDVLCLMLFILTWVAMIGVAIVGFVGGNPKLLLAPTDSEGNKCGVTKGVTDRPYLHFFDVSRCIQSINRDLFTQGIVCNTPQVCVKACPSENANGLTGPKKQDTKLYCRNGQTLAQTALRDRPALISNNTCAPYYLKSEVILSRCVPTLVNLNLLGSHPVRDSSNNTLSDNGGDTVSGDSIIESVKLVARLLNLRSIAEKVWADFQKVWGHLMVGFLITVILCFVFIALASIVLAPMIYLSMLGTLGLLGYISYISYVRYESLKAGLITRPTSANSFLDEYMYQEDTFLALCIIFASQCVILFFICLFMLGRIRFAVAVIKEATKAMFAIKAAFLFPILPALTQIVLFAYFVGIGLFLITSGDAEYTLEIFSNDRNTTSMAVNVDGKNMTVASGESCFPTSSTFKSLQNVSNGINCGFVNFNPGRVLAGMQIFHIVGWLWTANFIAALGQCVLAGAFSSYYWLNASKTMPRLPIFVALKRTLFYHTGSVAFGAAIITIVQLIRITLAYLETKLKEHGDNTTAKYILRCLQCLFACLEKFLKFINKNAYIEIAVYGYNFCKAARTAFSLLLRNVLRVAAINGITSFILLMGKCLITIIVATASYLTFANINDSQDLHYYLGPVIVLTLGAYFISSSFLDTYDMAVDTIFLCVLEDLEHNDGSSEQPYFMSSGMRRALKVKDKGDPKIKSSSEE